MKSALIYARLGWAVVPLHSVRPDGTCTCEPRPDGKSCTSQGKHPRVADWGKAATRDESTIAEWVERWQDGNVGIATGSTSGVFALDVDPENGGTDSLARLIAEHGPLPVTTEAATGGGGSHYLFAMPNHPVPNSAGKVGRGLDIRGDGGQIVVAPSRSAKGQYRWVRPPWTTPPALAPAWLLERLGRAPTRAETSADGSARGYFPPASSAVLEAAREALEQHGPAIEGQGGDAHTFIAAADLVHNFALTDEEAWPLLLEWNETCQPPWDEDDLRAKLRGGGKYGSAPYGCKRSMDSVEAARKLIQDWQARGEQDPIPLVVAVRPLAAIAGDPTKHALIAKELSDATGLNVRALGLPKPAAPTTPKQSGEIRVTTKLAQVAAESLRAIAPLVFSRNGALCEVVAAERTFINDLEPARIQEFMSRSATYVRHDEAKGVIEIVAPERVATMLHHRQARPGVRVLEALTTAPVFLADGSILQERGYNAQARVFLEPNVVVDVADRPTRADARAAVEVFRSLLSDFRFRSAADFASWMAALLSPLVKSATGNAPAPLVCVSASSAGAGKSLLTEVIAAIICGGAAELRPYNPRDEAEWGKRLTAFVKAASPVSVFDNINGEIGDPGLDKLITSSTWSDRLLGASEAPPLPNVTTWLATGNNIEPRGDTVRRVLMVRLEVMMERPQDRTGFRHPLLTEYALAHRSELLGAALTLLRAYHVAGRPEQSLPAWGSFPVWSPLVRGALVWAGCADPYETQVRAGAELNESEHDTHDFWLRVVAGCDGLASSIVMLAEQQGAREELGLRESLTTHHLRRFIGRFVDRPRGGRWIRRKRDAERNQTRYVVEVVS